MTVSHWRRSASPARIDCDAVVVGAGITGVSAALAMERRGLDVRIVERHTLATGASARNAGFLMRGCADHYSEACRIHGRELSKWLWRLTEENLASLRALGADQLPSFRSVPSCLLAMEISQEADLLRSCVQMEADGFEARFSEALAPVTARYGMTWRLDVVGRPVRTLLLASTATHCVNDLLYRQRSGHLPIDVPLILSNHETVRDIADFYGIPFEHRAIAGPDDKADFEARVLEVVAEHRIELVVLARYMQILSPELCEALAGMAINIHHSFLPGFKGANPYRQAHARGVKLIGATAHFVTTDLDEGPISEQDVVRVDHSHSPEQLQQLGQDEEARTLRRAVTWFAENRILLDGDRTIIFR